MDRIIITEADTTKPKGGATVTDVAYIPGLVNFVHGENESAPEAKVGSIYVINSETDFVKYLGKSPVIFNNSSGQGNYSEIGISYEKDMSYVYARNLVKQGLTIAYDVLGNEATSVRDIYTKMSSGNESNFISVEDVGEIDVKYITSGAYPSLYYFNNSEDVNNSSYNSDIAKKMISVASKRGDAVAIIDHELNINSSFYSAAVNTQNGFDNGNYATMFTPWGNYSTTAVDNYATLPGSYGYLSALAKSIKTNANYLAVAGVARGVVPNIENLVAPYTVTNKVADDYQSTAQSVTAINGITRIEPYGLSIWGNRTMLKNQEGGLVATSYLNIRNMLSDIKKELRRVALTLLFEQNSDVLWLKFTNRISEKLDKMVAGNGILAYNLIRNKTDDKSKFSVDVVIQPVYPVESVEISVVITDNDVTVA